MKNIIKIFALILALSATICAFVACQNNTNEEPKPVTYTNYTVSVVDDYGNPISGVIVKFTNEADESKSRVTDKDGKAAYINAVAARYIVNLTLPNDDYSLTRYEYLLTESENDLTVVCRDLTKTVDIYGEVIDGAYGHKIYEGEHKFSAKAGDTVYFVLNVLLSGKYEISFTSEDENMIVGYYGNPMFVQSAHRGDGEYDGKTFSLEIHDTYTPYVIGLTYTKDVEATLIIKRAGETTFDPNFDVPVVSVESTRGDLNQVNIPEDAVIVDFDVTDPTLSVYLADDGYYYTSDGKLVYLRLGSVGEYEDYMYFTPASLKDMVALGVPDDSIGVVGGINFGGFVYDENGNYVARNIYNDMLESYWEVCDGRYGAYPLTDELAEAIIVHGENAGWWNVENEYTCLFINDQERPLVVENAWLFLCFTIA